MTEVSCRAFVFYTTAEAAGACRVDALLAGLPITREQLERPGGRVSWDVWARLADRFAEACGSDEALAESSRYAMNERFIGALVRLRGLFSDPLVFYRVAMGWVAPSLYRSVRFTVTEVDHAEIRIEASLLPGFRESRAWFFLFAHGALRAPTMLGFPASEGRVVSVDGRSAVVAVPRRASRSRWSRLLAWLRSGQVVADELVAQQKELTRAFDDMRSATASFQNVLDALPLAVAVLREDRIRYANPSLAALVGRDARALTGHPLAELVHPEDVPALAVLEHAGAGVARLRLRAAEVVLEARVVTGVPFEGEPSVIVLGLDVSHEVQAAAIAERGEATIRLLIATQPELVVRLDRTLKVLDVRPGQEVTGATILADAQGLHLRDLLVRAPPEVRDRLTEAVAAYEADLAHGQVFERSLILPSPDGTSRELHLRATPVMGGAESIVVIRDETRRREAERRLALAEHLASLGALTAGVAHEINNPLTYVKLTIDLLAQRITTLPEHDRAPLAEIVSALGEGTERIRATVGRMKAVSHVPAETRSPIAPRGVAERALALAAHETTSRARVTAQLADTRRVLADETELGQVFINLLINAAQALDRVPAPPSGPHRIEVCLTEEGGAIVFTCTDTGGGIAPEWIDRIFEPFFTTRDRKGGTGLGLAIVHRIVQDLGGAITVSSTLGSGTTFRVTLPATDEVGGPLPGAADPVAPPPPGRAARVFVIDDEPMILNLFERILRGHEVVLFRHAAAALTALADGDTPDLVLCDLEMPGMSGMELYAGTTRMRPELAARFVFLTGGAFTAAAMAFTRRPGVRILDKPVASTTLRLLAAESIVDRAP